MSVRQGNKVIAGHINYRPDLFDYKWADHILNDVSWLRADTFSWQDGGVYQAAYQHLVEDYNDGPLESETINGQLIYFHRAPDGHKVVMVYDDDTHHKAVETIYNATGVAWYYILDTTNQRFKLPRTKFGFTGIRSGVGNYVEAGSPNITGTFYRNAFIGSSGASQNSISGAFTSTNANGYHAGGGGLDNSAGVVTLDASRSSPIYGNSNTVQPKATEMYLYFYVGNFTQTALENTAGVVTEDFNELNAHKVIAFQAPNAGNNYTWYRKYADGWVEQGGKVPGATSASAINFPVTMADSNYYINGHVFGNTDTNGNWIKFGTLTTTGTTYVTGYGANNMWAMNSTWEVKGIAA